MLIKGLDKHLVERLFSQGLTCSEVAKELNVSSATVTYWKRKLNLPLCHRTHDWKKIQSAHDNGSTYVMLYEKFGVTKRSLQMARNRGEFTPRKKEKLGIEERTRRKLVRNREAWMRYHSRKKYQTPADENIKALQEFYAKCPDGYEVDHIIPISKGGAHTLSNLQYLTKAENRRKSNKLI